MEGILAYFESLNPIKGAFIATLFTWGLTALGASLVFFVKKLQKNQINKIIVVGNGLEDLLTLTFNASCFKKEKLGEITFRYEIKKDCDEFR